MSRSSAIISSAAVHEGVTVVKHSSSAGAQNRLRRNVQNLAAHGEIDDHATDTGTILTIAAAEIDAENITLDPFRNR